MTQYKTTSYHRLCTCWWQILWCYRIVPKWQTLWTWLHHETGHEPPLHFNKISAWNHVIEWMNVIHSAVSVKTGRRTERPASVKQNKVSETRDGWTITPKKFMCFVWKGVFLRMLGCWDCRFESHCGRGNPSVVFMACCVGRGLWAGLIARLEES